MKKEVILVIVVMIIVAVAFALMIERSLIKEEDTPATTAKPDVNVHMHLNVYVQNLHLSHVTGSGNVLGDKNHITREA